MTPLSTHCTYRQERVTDSDCLACFGHPNHAQIRRLARGRDGRPRRMNCVRMHLLTPTNRP